MRGDPRDKNLIPANLEEIKDMHDFILKNRREYLKKNPAGNAILGFLNKFAALGHANYTQKIKEEVLSGKKWPMKCAAGNSIAVIYPNGDAALCELKEPIGNLRQYNYDLNRILSGADAGRKKERIRKNKCRCTHICFINASIAADWKTIPKIFYYFLKSL
jgi:MoaA/NifB/PqqE/SkfB family radical SAM enzyme